MEVRFGGESGITFFFLNYSILQCIFYMHLVSLGYIYIKHNSAFFIINKLFYLKCEKGRDIK